MWPAICCYLLVLHYGQAEVFTITAEKPILTLDALDCKTSKVSYGKASEFCSEKRDDGPKTPLREIALIQSVNRHTIKAIRCTLTVSESNHMCARWSHMKLLSPPKYAVVSEITPSVCRQIHATGVYTDGQTYPVTVNSKLHYQKIERGVLKLTPDNVECDGEEAFIGGVLHSQVMTFRDITLMMEEVELEIDYTSSTATDLTNRQLLDDSCFSARACQSSNQTYFKLDAEIPCKFQRIKNLKVEEVVMQTDKGTSQMLISHEDKIALEKGISVNPSLECTRYVAKYHLTNIDDLFIVYASDLKSAKLQRVGGESVSIRTEMVAESQYLAVQSILKSEGFHYLTTDRICHQIASTIDSVELSPFMENAIIKRRGDLLVNIACRPVIVSVQLGSSWKDTCLSGYLPAMFGDKRVLISQGTHVIYDQSDMDLFPAISCKNAPFFVTKNGQIIQQKPQIEVVNITIAKFGSFGSDLSGNQIDQIDIFNSEGLYSEDEFAQFEELVHFGRKRQMITDKVIDRFCKDNSCLGTDRYNFDQFGPNPAGIMKSAVKWLQESFLARLQEIGSYASIIVVFLYAVQLIRCLYRKVDSLLHLRFLFRRKGDERQQCHDPERQDREFHHSPGYKSEQIEMIRLPEALECKCLNCQGVRHETSVVWPRGHCGRACCRHHLRTKCKPFEWHVLDPQNLAFDHRDVDEKFKALDANMLTRTECRCDICMQTTTHPPWKYLTEVCGCIYCENCIAQENKYRSQSGISMCKVLSGNGGEHIGTHLE